jgi:hypothetical protein
VRHRKKTQEMLVGTLSRVGGAKPSSSVELAQACHEG